MSHWTLGSVLKSQGRRGHRNNLLVRNETRIKQQKLNRMGNIGLKMRLMTERKENAGQE